MIVLSLLMDTSTSTSQEGSRDLDMRKSMDLWRCCWTSHLQHQLEIPWPQRHGLYIYIYIYILTSYT
ncbi:hypothetical protein I7I53_03430 [Histoplasma capsulatum var. duboisii H88]|uniref:Uncharacterized protein n=1 Tax=Ajellomyces capsulatus (strain H88) TaxID=544711 RepID=A0A8A1LU89_AJEC8|nr:hypothetical protein I7I53_03430 [Histoplasma capsulatum var. duboisii H88]